MSSPRLHFLFSFSGRGARVSLVLLIKKRFGDTLAASLPMLSEKRILQPSPELWVFVTWGSTRCTHQTSPSSVEYRYCTISISPPGVSRVAVHEKCAPTRRQCGCVRARRRRAGVAVGARGVSAVGSPSRGAWCGRVGMWGCGCVGVHTVHRSIILSLFI